MKHLIVYKGTLILISTLIIFNDAFSETDIFKLGHQNVIKKDIKHNRIAKVLWPSIKDKEEIIKNHTEIAKNKRPIESTLDNNLYYNENIETETQNENQSELINTPLETVNYVKEEQKDPTDTNEEQITKKDAERKGRIFWSYPQSPIVEMMMQTVAVNYSPKNYNDPFDFLRDSYTLPKGNNFFYLCV